MKKYKMDFQKIKAELKSDTKTWLFPTLCLLFFLYIMVFTVLYTYIYPRHISVFDSIKDDGMSLDGFQKMMEDAINKNNLK